MKLRSLKMLMAGFVVFSLRAMPAMAHEEKGPHDEMQEAKELQKSGNISDIFKEIKEHEEHLQMLIQNEPLDQVHEVAFVIRDLSKAVQEKSEGLSLVDHDKIRSSVDEISQVAERLDQYGDSGNKAKTQEEFGRLEQLIQTLEEQFPKVISG